jgi:hypothetical protein
MITRIKEIHWWDPKLKQDALTYKVWVNQNGQTELHYFTSQKDLDLFSKTFEPKQKKAKKNDTPPV